MREFIFNLLSNWKTTLAGVLALVGLVFQCVLSGGNILDCISNSWPIVFAGVGLVFAKDYTSQE